jgi:NAD(P)-dependent dehydrogenase (short-subunit alcohol dehydrogenase family)
LTTTSPLFARSTVLLTGVGAPGQVGEAVARTFAEAGAALVLVDRTRASVEARAAELTSAGYMARGYTCDLTDETSVAQLARDVRAHHGDALHGLVHMAGGFAMSGPVSDASFEVWNRQIAINLTTAFLTTRAFLPALRIGKGAIVLFASEAALPGKVGANRSAYAVAKNGIAALMQSIAAEERGNGVRANALAPSSIRTAANTAAMGENAQYVERDDVAAVALFLCSPGARAISGVLLPLA